MLSRLLFLKKNRQWDRALLRDVTRRHVLQGQWRHHRIKIHHK